MRRIILLFIAGAVTFAAVRPIVAQPSESGSTTSGHRIAITICRACHGTLRLPEKRR